MLVHHRVTPSIMSPVLIYIPGWREALSVTSMLNVRILSVLIFVLVKLDLLETADLAQVRVFRVS